MPRNALTSDEIECYRDSFCDVALTLYEQQGYEAVTMRGIAKAMRASPMMAYRYFDDKEDVFAAVRARLFHRLADALSAVPQSLFPVHHLRALGEAYADFAQSEPHAYRILYVVHLQQSRPYPEMASAQKRTQKILLGATQRAVEAGELSGDAATVAHTLWASIHGLVSLHLAGQLTQGAVFRELLPHLLDTLLMPSHLP